MASNPLWDRWKARLDELHRQLASRGGVDDPDNFMSQLQGERTERSIEVMRRNYRRLYADRELLLNLRKQEDWADVREKIRFLVFRTALAVIIAGVVLGTAYLAQLWGIPLPLLRMGP